MITFSEHTYIPLKQSYLWHHEMTLHITWKGACYFTKQNPKYNYLFLKHKYNLCIKSIQNKYVLSQYIIHLWDIERISLGPDWIVCLTFYVVHCMLMPSDDIICTLLSIFYFESFMSKKNNSVHIWPQTSFNTVCWYSTRTNPGNLWTTDMMQYF